MLHWILFCLCFGQIYCYGTKTQSNKMQELSLQLDIFNMPNNIYAGFAKKLTNRICQTDWQEQASGEMKKKTWNCTKELWFPYVLYTQPTTSRLQHTLSPPISSPPDVKSDLKDGQPCLLPTAEYLILSLAWWAAHNTSLYSYSWSGGSFLGKVYKGTIGWELLPL